MTGLRRVQLMVLTAASFVLAAAAAQAQDLPKPDTGGNTASQSIGTVQVGPATADPTSTTAGTPVGDAAGTVSATVGTAGGNSASGSGGVVQAGGNNRTTRSAGIAQVSPTGSKTSAQARPAGLNTQATIGGTGPSSADGSVVAAQVGGGNTANGTTGTAQVQPTSARVDSTAGSAIASTSGQQALGDTLGVSTSGLSEAPASATDVVLQVVHALLPGVPVTAAVGRLVDAGMLRITESGDNMAVDLGSLTVEITSLAHEPQLAVGILGTQLELGTLVQAGDGVDGTATDSLATVQAGGGNTATSSIGTAQVGSLAVAPHASASSEETGAAAQLGGGSAVADGDNTANGSLGTVQIGSVSASPAGDAGVDGVGTVSAGGSSGIGGGSNVADGSIGTAQIGGGNSSNGSAGTVQSGSVTVGPAAQASATPLHRSARVGGSSTIGGGGNDADRSIGVAQIGGGNVSSGSIGTAQSRSVDAAPTASTAGTTLAPSINVGGSGSGRGNTATGSIGTIQVGVGNTADRSIGTAQGGPTTIGRQSGGQTGGTGSGTGSTPGSAQPAATAPAKAAGENAPEQSQGRTTVRPAAGPPTAEARSRGKVKAGHELVKPTQPAPSGGNAALPVLGAKLPFTGLALWLALLVAASLIVAGAGLRRVAVRLAH